MKFLNPFRRGGTAPIARERLKILLSHEREVKGQFDLLAVLKKEIRMLITKYVLVESDYVHVRIERGGTISTLEINVAIPHSSGLLLGTTFEARTRSVGLDSQICAHA
jgi:cell division topological specificity factor